MSSTDASDLVDSDETGVPMTSKSERSTPRRKPSSDKAAGAESLAAFRSQDATRSAAHRKKRSRIASDGRESDVALESGAPKGKGKARAKSDSSSRSAASTAASKATARTRRSVRAKRKPAESSSSWQSSSSSSGIEHNNRRSRTRGTVGDLAKRRTRGGGTLGEDVPPAGGPTGCGTNRRKHRCPSQSDEAQILKYMKSSVPSGGLKTRLRPIRSGTGTRVPATRARETCLGRFRSKNTVVGRAPATSSPKQLSSNASYTCNQGGDDGGSEHEDEEDLKTHRDARRSMGRGRDSAAVGGRNRSDKRQGPCATKLRVLEDGKQQNTTVDAAGASAALSKGNHDADVLRDTDSEVDHGSDNDEDDESVRCRCGVVHRNDGTRWIRCDGRGCGAWEHFSCVYPEGAAAVGTNEGGSEEPPETHLCLSCEGGPTSTFQALPRGRLLIRGDGFSPSKRRSKPTPASANAAAPGDRKGRVAATVRRSLRVIALQEESRPLPRRKNVVGDEAYGESSSSDIEVVSGHDIGVREDSDDVYLSDGFMVPEGKVETIQKFRCRCGASREQDKIGGLTSKSAAWKNQAAERWVQCRSDPCRVLEHAACCDHGCSESERRHWCRACDPEGKKHAKSAQRQNPKRRKRRCLDRSKGSGGQGSPSMTSDARDRPVVNNGQGSYDKSRVLLDRLWRAVVAGDATSVEQTFREAEDEKLNTVQQLLEAEAPTEMLVGGSYNGETRGYGREVAQVQPVGITLLMFAAGYWIVHAAAAAAVDSLTENVGCNDAGTGSCALDGAAATAAAAAEALVGAEQRVDFRAEIEQKGEGEGDSAPRKVTADEKDPHSIPEGGGGSREYGAGAEPRRREDAPDLGSEARLAVLKAVLDRSYDGAVQAVDGSGRTAVHHASAVNAASEVALLLGGQRGVAVALATDHEGMTPLHVAAAAGQAQACASILESLKPRARARAISATERASGESALHVACAEGRAGCVEAIFREEKSLNRELNRMGVSSHEPLVLVRSLHGTTPLMAAAGCPSIACVRLVLDNLLGRRFGKLGEALEELRAVDDGGMNALHWAAGRDAKGSVEAAKAVLEAERPLARLRSPYEYGGRATSASGVGSGVGFGRDPLAMINARENENGASPLHLAAAVSHKEMVSLLLQQGANSVMRDEQGWTPVMYADFDGRKEGTVLELLRHEPEKQLEALGHVLSSRDDRQHPRVVEVMRNLVTVPAFFSLVNGFVRKNPHLLVTTLAFLRDEPGLLDFENKMNLLRTLLTTPDLDLATRTALDHAARPPLEGFGYSYSERIQLHRRPGEALAALLLWMEEASSRWGDSGLAAWLRIRLPSFVFSGEAGHGPGVDREAWELISEDLVRPCILSSPSSSYAVQAASERAASGDGSNATPRGETADAALEAFFVPVDRGMTSYCPRDMRRVAPPAGSAGYGGGGGGSSSGWREEEEDLRAFELLGVIIGANLIWNKVLNLNLNPVVWKTVLSRNMRLSDLELVDGMYYRSLKQVLDTEGADQLALTFDCLELKFCADGGGVDPDDDVTDENKERYAALALESRTFGRWRAQSHALSKGLRRLVPLRLLKMFTKSELGLLLAGPGEIDPHDWQRHAVFSGEASALFQAWFWSVVRSLTKEERSLLLQFATGCSRLPAGGFSGLPRPFTVSMLDYDPRRPLPMAATCFYMLKLPRYPEKYLLRRFLRVGIRHGSTGFEFS